MNTAVSAGKGISRKSWLVDMACWWLVVLFFLELYLRQPATPAWMQAVGLQLFPHGVRLPLLVIAWAAGFALVFSRPGLHQRDRLNQTLGAAALTCLLGSLGSASLMCVGFFALNTARLNLRQVEPAAPRPARVNRLLFRAIALVLWALAAVLALYWFRHRPAPPAFFLNNTDLLPDSRQALGLGLLWSAGFALFFSRAAWHSRDGLNRCMGAACLTALLGIGSIKFLMMLGIAMVALARWYRDGAKPA